MTCGHAHDVGCYCVADAKKPEEMCADIYGKPQEELP
jgi:hypothetical protein